MTTNAVSVRRFGARELILSISLFMASVQCVRSCFLVNASLLVLPKYAAGTERMPFQGRVSPMPFITWSEHSALMARIASYVARKLHYPRFTNAAEVYSPEKVMCMALGLAATLLAVAFLGGYGWRRLGRYWWTPAALFLLMLFLTYGARSEQQFWYPYDLPHFALFGAATLCVLEEAYLPALLLFALDVPTRETSIYLVPVVMALAYARRRWRSLWWAAAMVAVWAPIRLMIAHRFAGNENWGYVHWYFMKQALFNPLHWPQLTSAFGYLLVPFFFNFKQLTRDERYFLLGAVPGLVLTAVYGIWYETRIWDEWMMPMAVLLTVQFMRLRATETVTVHEVELAEMA